MYTSEDGAEYIRRYGTRLEVWDEVVYETAGHLKKSDLEKRGSRIVSKRRSALGKKRFAEKNPFKKQEDEKKPEPTASVAADKPDREQGPPKRLRKVRRKKRAKAV